MTAKQNRPIVSSRHLAEGEGRASSEYEFGLIVAYNAFTRWIQRCMAAAGFPELSATEILVLHNTNHRDRKKRLTDIAFLLNIEDTHTITYALRKLVKLELLTTEKRGKEVFYATSEAGQQACAAYRDIRNQCLVDGLNHTGLSDDDLAEMAKALRLLSGHYDQASRSASSL
ncbi:MULTISPECIES: winged helix DNA-binding protein [Halocynthiibacter]|uniref:Winged helix DNA-binding protein n=1 Tax=Halocynthiibacter halioticoli TaxID=2986804 RepID=A0AAE3IZT4_9RHOB|nr:MULTISPECIES: winged helix DNA-binding protein [Halocynthiibacter]MCV6825115.1 winged helix DNA-binding protein [Halocynthiibacter halioticoli]MCW4058116.1 winged helix DNA-binding protein [Halocynthiibacter sp. SDUM655004]